MNTLEVINILRLENKPYTKVEPPMPQSTFSNTISAIKAGTCKQKTIKEFFARFGYFQETIQWKKL